MRYLPIYLLYAATALRGTIMIAARRDPTLSAALLAAYGVLLLSEPWVNRRLASRSVRLAGRYRVLYMLVQIGLILGIVLPGPTPDALLALFFPLAFQAVQFFGWRAGRWWIVAFLAPMLAYVIRHPDPNNRIMSLVFEAGCFLLGALAGMTQRAEAARAENLRMAQELQAAQKELEKYTSQVEELAAERARTLLARELHDSVTQTVFSMNLAVEAARLTLPKGPAATAAQLDRVQSLSKSALGEIQKLVSQLQPPGGDGQGLVSGIRRLVARYRTGEELEVDLQAADGQRDLPPAASANLCNIVQETLANVKKHAGTRQACVRMDLGGRPAWVEVEDRGCGFDLGSALSRPGHLGLTEMAERAREIGWRLSIDSQPGRGTRVRIEEALEGAE